MSALNILDTIDPTVAFGIWGYDLRGEHVTEFTATIAEGHDSNGAEWDRPEWLDGWYRDGQPYKPPLHRALPWVMGRGKPGYVLPPTRCMWRPRSQWDAELAGLERYEAGT